MTVIVVEGVDGSGKTTLMDNLRLANGPRRYYTLIRHSGRPLKIRDVKDFLGSLTVSYGMLRIIDRHPFISEPIYGPILRGVDMTGDWSEDRKIQVLKNTVDRIIYCRPPLPRIVQNLDNNPQLSGVKERITSLVTAYDRMMNILIHEGIRVIEYDFTSDLSADYEKMFFA